MKQSIITRNPRQQNGKAFNSFIYVNFILGLYDVFHLCNVLKQLPWVGIAMCFINHTCSYI